MTRLAHNTFFAFSAIGLLVVGVVGGFGWLITSIDWAPFWKFLSAQSLFAIAFFVGIGGFLVIVPIGRALERFIKD